MLSSYLGFLQDNLDESLFFFGYTKLTLADSVNVRFGLSRENHGKKRQAKGSACFLQHLNKNERLRLISGCLV